MGQFKSTLNSKSVYGYSYWDKETLRIFKYNRVTNLSKNGNKLKGRWYKRSKLISPSWSDVLFNWDGMLSYSQCTENMDSKKKYFHICRWRA